MSRAERDKWDARYRDGAYRDRTHPTALVAAWLPRIARGSALDVACGAGRNALHLASHGFTVSALDISAVGLERGRDAAAIRAVNVEWLCADLDEPPDRVLPPGPFALVVWVRYIHGTLMPHLVARLAPGGTLICEQHLKTTAEVAGPGAAFRVAAGELARAAGGLEVLYSHEGLVVDPDGRMVALAQLVAQRT